MTQLRPGTRRNGQGSRRIGDILQGVYGVEFTCIRTDDL
jgi:hypothetical protein